jgi:ATP-independent RNA helicase DbpA
VKNEKEILTKLGIDALNAMQQKAMSAIQMNSEVMLLSPTGTGKTLAFALPLVKGVNLELAAVQILIVVPSRELAIQIEQVIREMGSGVKINAVYGGRSVKKDLIELEHQPHILVGTPGRVADHIRRNTFKAYNVKTLVLDEFDKSLEVGFDKEMIEICDALKGVEKKILTSATEGVNVPEFVRFRKPAIVDFLEQKVDKLSIKVATTQEKDKLKGLLHLLNYLGPEPGILFCNFKDSIQRISNFLNENGINHGIFQGGMEQKDRERALIKFRNGSYPLLLATDLAARGLDIPALSFIIHYQLPFSIEEFIHRNGRTARMHQSGTAYILKYKAESLPDYLKKQKMEEIIVKDLGIAKKPKNPSNMATLFVSGGRKDKISKGDLAGFFIKQGGLENDALGLIELKNDCAFVGVPLKDVKHLIAKLNNQHVKKRKVRVYLIE